MSEDVDRITRVRVATIVHELDRPVVFGTWVIRFREFALVRVDSESGHAGFAYCLTRDGPVASVVERTVGPVVVGQAVADPAATFRTALWSNHAIHASGVGMRAVSTVDVAAWDLAARAAGQDIATFLGGAPRPMPVTAIVGYPPSISAQDMVDQISGLWAGGWRRFKLPIGLTPDASIERLRLAREAFPGAWLGLDNNFLHRTADEAIAFGRRLDGFGLGWFEDIVPPGDAAMVAAIRQGIGTPIAMGDEQGGSYHPQALLAHDAVDVLRIDATTNGGVTRLREILVAAAERGVPVAPHMYPHLHSRILAVIGRGDEPIEWGIPGTGVHPMDDSLAQPLVRDGFMDPLPAEPGFGTLVEPAWLARQQVDDPDGLLDDLA